MTALEPRFVSKGLDVVEHLEAKHDDVKRYSTEVVATTVQFLGSKPAEGSSSSKSSSGGPPSEGGWNDNYIPSDPGDDDIPF